MCGSTLGSVEEDPVWRLLLVVSVLRKPRQEDCHESEASLHYSVTLCSKGRHNIRQECGKGIYKWHSEELPQEEEVLNCSYHVLSPWEEGVWAMQLSSTHTERAILYLLAEKVAAAFLPCG